MRFHGQIHPKSTLEEVPVLSLVHTSLRGHFCSPPYPGCLVSAWRVNRGRPSLFAVLLRGLLLGPALSSEAQAFLCSVKVLQCKQACQSEERSGVAWGSLGLSSGGSLPPYLLHRVCLGVLALLTCTEASRCSTLAQGLCANSQSCPDLAVRAVATPPSSRAKGGVKKSGTAGGAVPAQLQALRPWPAAFPSLT